MSETLERVRRLVCERHGHRHDDQTELACLARALSVVRGEVSARELDALLRAAEEVGWVP